MAFFEEHVLLSQHSSYRIGGLARYFVEPKSIAELTLAVAKSHAENLPIFVLGGGTNLMIPDEGFPGLVVKPAFHTLKAARAEVTGGSGIPMSDLLKFMVAKGFSGLEWAGGLPGTLGGAIRGNAGAFGGEIKDVVSSVTSLRIVGHHPEIMTRTATECRFGYRTSIFKEKNGEEIILSAVLRLTKGDKKAIGEAIADKIRYRKERHPMEYPNVGSIFKNVPVTQISADIKEKFADLPVKNDPFPIVPTAYLIAQAGLKGVSSGGAMVSPKHPNFIVNALSASSEDVRSLIRLVKHTVYEKFGVALEEEVIYV